jgi:hypothetical protein
VIAARYGDQIAFRADWSDIHFPSNSSSWWKDLRGIESAAISLNWVSGGLNRKIGNGVTTSFWLENWIGGVTLRDKFPRLFSLSNQKEATISEVVGLGFDRGVLSLRRGLFDWEEELVGQLEILLHNVTLSLVSDKWNWSFEDDGVFSVKSAYQYLASVMGNLTAMPAMEALVFKKIWSSPASSKIIAFSWQLLYNGYRLKGICLVEVSGILWKIRPVVGVLTARNLISIFFCIVILLNRCGGRFAIGWV